MKRRAGLIPLILVTLMATVASTHATQPPNYVEGELLVKFRDGPRGLAAELARNRMQHEIKRNFDFVGWQHIRLPRGTSVEEGLTRYKELPGVLAVEPNYAGPAIDS